MNESSADTIEIWIGRKNDQVELRHALSRNGEHRYSLHGRADWIPLNSWDELTDAQHHVKLQGYRRVFSSNTGAKS